MEKLKHFFTNQSKKLSGTILRFYLPFSMLIALFFIAFSTTIWNFNQTVNEIIYKLSYTLVFGVTTCTIAEILYEKYFRGKLSKTVLNIIALIISAIAYILLHFYDDKSLVFLALLGIAISEIIFILYFSKTDSMSKTFSHYFKSFVFNLSVCAITFGGISLCIFAFTTLIHDFKDVHKAYYILGEFVGIVLFGTMLLSNVPKLGQKITIPKIFKFFVANVMLPIYLLLLFILYIYLAKILFTWTFPSNQVNLFVSFSSLLFVFFAFSLNQYKNENKALSLFLKFGGLLVIPTIAMQFVAIYIRISNYGLTTFRYVSIVLNIFAAVFAIMTLLWREKNLKRSLVVLVGFILLITATPLNAYDIPIREQSHRLKTLLLNNNMLAEDGIIPNSNIALEEKNKILESYQYIKFNFEVASYKPNFLSKDLIEKPEEQIFGFKPTYGINPYNHSISFEYSYDYIDVSNYSKLYRLHEGLTLTSTENGEILLNNNGTEQVIDGLYDYLKNLNVKYKDSGEDRVTTEKIEYEFGNSKLVLPHIRLYQIEDENKDETYLKVDFFGNYYLLEK